MHSLPTTSLSLWRGREASGRWHGGRTSNGLAPHLATRPHAAAALMDEPVSGATFMKSLLDLMSSSLHFFFFCYLLTVGFKKTLWSGITREIKFSRNKSVFTCERMQACLPDIVGGCDQGVSVACPPRAAV